MDQPLSALRTDRDTTEAAFNQSLRVSVPTGVLPQRVPRSDAFRKHGLNEVSLVSL